MAKGQKRQSLARPANFSRLSCRGSVAPIKGRRSKEERDGEEEATPGLTVLRQLTDHEFFGEDSLVGRRAAPQPPRSAPLILSSGHAPYYMSTSRFLHAPHTTLRNRWADRLRRTRTARPSTRTSPYCCATTSSSWSRQVILLCSHTTVLIG